MNEIQVGCRDAKEAKEIAATAIDQTVKLEGKIDWVLALALFASIVSIVFFLSFAYNAKQINERLQRLERLDSNCEIARTQ